jgi:hypothetical protein
MLLHLVTDVSYIYFCKKWNKSLVVFFSLLLFYFCSLTVLFLPGLAATSFLKDEKGHSLLLPTLMIQWTSTGMRREGGALVPVVVCQGLKRKSSRCNIVGVCRRGRQQQQGDRLVGRRRKKLLKP